MYNFILTVDYKNEEERKKKKRSGKEDGAANKAKIKQRENRCHEKNEGAVSWRKLF